MTRQQVKIVSNKGHIEGIVRYIDKRGYKNWQSIIIDITKNGLSDMELFVDKSLNIKEGYKIKLFFYER